MSHRSKHLRRNWLPERLLKSTERAWKESSRPAPQPRQRQHRVLPVSHYLRQIR